LATGPGAQAGHGRGRAARPGRHGAGHGARLSVPPVRRRLVHHRHRAPGGRRPHGAALSPGAATSGTRQIRRRPGTDGPSVPFSRATRAVPVTKLGPRNARMDRFRLLAGRTWPVAALVLAGCTGSGATGPDVEVPGRPESGTTRALETGAAIMQRDAPTDALEVYLVGFHPMKDEPEHQFEAHHFCQQVNEDFAQCALYDGNTAEANLNGIEYIISERLFETLPADERPYWHPHNGEILSGQLVAPGLPEAAEKELMRTKINSYGKTWHTWNTGHGGEGGDDLPLGAPAL